MINNKLPDTPWHVGFTKKEDGDPRRHKSRCVYMEEKKCRCSRSYYYDHRCPGSAHCQFYAENSYEDEIKRYYAQSAEALEAKKERADKRLQLNTPSKERSNKKGPRPVVFVGDSVKHKKWGVGTVIVKKHDKITVSFIAGPKSFQYPNAFVDGYLTLCE